MMRLGRTGPSTDKLRSEHIVGILGLIVFLTQAILSQVYYLERTACYDPAFFSFLMLDSGSLESVLGRHGSWLSQLLPWVVLKSGGSLELFLRSYSLSFILLYFIFFLVTLYAIKDKRAAIAMVICCTVGYHLSFYYSTAELYQGLALTCMLWAVLRKLKEPDKKKRILWSSFTVLLTIWISFYHQILIIPVTFLIAFELFEGKLRSINTHQWIVFGAMIGWFMIRILAFEKSSYEASRMVTLEDFKTYLPGIDRLPSALYFRWEINELPALIISSLMAGVLLLFRKKWMQFLVFGSACLGFLVLILITDHAGQSPVMYENYYTVFGLFAAIAIAGSLYDPTKGYRFFVSGAVTSLLLIAGVVQIYNGHRPFTVLVDHFDQTTIRMLNRGQHKGIVHMENHPWSFSWMAWPTPFSSVLISAVNNNGWAATIYASPDPGSTMSNNTAPNTFLGPEWEENWFTSDNLNEAIRIPAQPYSVITTTARTINERDSLRPSITLEVLKDTIPVDAGPKCFVPIRISNMGKDTLHARLPGNEMLRLYYWIDSGEGEKVNPEQFTQIDSDIYPGESAQFYLVIDTPSENGDHSIRFDLCSHVPERTWDISKKFVLRK